MAARLLSIYVLVQATFQLPHVAQTLFFGGRLDASSWAFVAAFLVLIVVGLILWTQAGRISRRLPGKAAPQALEGPITVDELERTAFSLLGLFILVGALPHLIANVAELIAPRTFDPFFRDDVEVRYRAGKAIETLGVAGRAAIGTWLVLGSRAFVATLRKLRERARSGPEYDADADVVSRETR